jgi:hypothetical protein
LSVEFELALFAPANAWSSLQPVLPCHPLTCMKSFHISCSGSLLGCRLMNSYRLPAAAYSMQMYSLPCRKQQQ